MVFFFTKILILEGVQMKKTFRCAFLLGLFITLCGCSSACRTACQTQQKAALPRCQKNIFLPSVIYAVPGVESNIYFKNIFLAVNCDNYLFDVECKYGAQRLKRWCFTPAVKDGGKSFPLEIKVYDEEEKLVASAATTVVVAPADAGKDKNISILIIGDSLTAATAYPRKLHKHCSNPGNPRLTMIGAHAGRGKKAVAGEVAHEGYGGWKWNHFFSMYKDEKNMEPRKRIAAKSKFLTKKDGKVVFDFANYLNQYNKGKTPDFITIQLGVNDVFSATSATLEKRISTILANADKLIGYIRKDAPDVMIGIGYVTPGADQNAFAVNYKCSQTSWGYLRNSFRLNQAMEKHFAGRKNICMIPVNVNLDTENNFPAKEVQINGNLKITQQNNGVHPSYWGYNQMGDSYFAWLKNQLAAADK